MSHVAGAIRNGRREVFVDASDEAEMVVPPNMRMRLPKPRRRLSFQNDSACSLAADVTRDGPRIVKATLRDRFWELEK